MDQTIVITGLILIAAFILLWMFFNLGSYVNAITWRLLQLREQDITGIDKRFHQARERFTLEAHRIDRLEFGFYPLQDQVTQLLEQQQTILLGFEVLVDSARRQTQFIRQDHPNMAWLFEQQVRDLEMLEWRLKQPPVYRLK